MSRIPTRASALGWTWDASDKAFNFATDPGTLTSSIDVHGDGDDLWTWYQQYSRTGSALPRAWAQRWRDYLVSRSDSWRIRSTMAAGKIRFANPASRSRNAGQTK